MINTDLVIRALWYPKLACLLAYVKWLTWRKQEFLFLNRKFSVTFYPQLECTDCCWIINLITQILIRWHGENIYNLKLRKNQLYYKISKSWHLENTLKIRLKLQTFLLRISSTKLNTTISGSLFLFRIRPRFAASHSSKSFSHFSI